MQKSCIWLFLKLEKRRNIAELQAELVYPLINLLQSPRPDGAHSKKRFLEQEKAIVHVLGSDKKCCHLVPTWQDLVVLESLNKAVKQLQDVTDVLSGEAYVSASYIKPSVQNQKKSVQKSLLQPEEEDTELTKTMKSNIMQYVDNKFSDPVIDELLDMSSLIDPRFRTTYIDPDKVEQVKKRAVTEAELMSLPPPASNSTPHQPGPAMQAHQKEA